MTARSFSPAIRSRTVPSRAIRNRSGVTSPATTTSPSPHAASTTSSSVPSIGFRVKRTPAQTASTSSCSTTPTRGVPESPIRFRYPSADSEWADRQIAATPSIASADEQTLSRVRCCPAKLAASESSPTADERRASGGRRTDHASSSFALAAGLPAASASTSSTESATPRGTGSPAWRAAASCAALPP